MDVLSNRRMVPNDLVDVLIICINVSDVVVAMIIIVIVKFIIKLVGDRNGLIILHSQIFFSVDHDII